MVLSRYQSVRQYKDIFGINSKTNESLYLRTERNMLTLQLVTFFCDAYFFYESISQPPEGLFPDRPQLKTSSRPFRLVGSTRTS